jgi:hypothetical protein
MVPNGIYTLHIKKVDNAPSNSGTPQTKIDLEIVAPAQVKHGDTTYEVAGVETSKRTWWSEKAVAMSIEMCRDIGLPAAATAETTEELQEALAGLEGMFINAMLEGRERVKRQTPLPGQKPWQAEPVRDDAGNVVTDGWEIVNVSFRPGTLRDRGGNYPF